MRKIVLLFCVAVFPIVILICELCNPKVPIASRGGGFYDEEFTLYFEREIGTTIYYTLDGSIPNVNSIRYDGNGVAITNRSLSKNIYNSIDRVVCDYKNYVVDDELVPKATVLRAVSISLFGIHSDIYTDTFYVGIDKNENNSLYVNVIFEPQDLFGENGLYVTGADYDAMYNSGIEDDSVEPNFLKKIEKPAYLQVYNIDGEVLSQDIGIRIQGSSNRYAQKKRFIFTANNGRIEESCFQHCFYSDKNGKPILTHSVMIKSALTDAIVGELLKNRIVTTQGAIPVCVYLNGEYWYDSYMLERFDKRFFKEYYNVDDVVLIKNAEAVNNDDGQQELYDSFVKFIDDADFSDECEYSDQYWKQLNEMMDVQSYIEFMVVNYYFCNIDISDNKNNVLWRSKYVIDDGYNDGRWRWCVYDIDSLYFEKVSSFKFPAEINTFNEEMPYIENSTLSDLLIFRKLKSNSQFRDKFEAVFLDMVNNDFSQANVENVLTKYGEDIHWMQDYFIKRPRYAKRDLAQLWQ